MARRQSKEVVIIPANGRFRLGADVGGQMFMMHKLAGGEIVLIPFSSQSNGSYSLNYEELRKFVEGLCTGAQETPPAESETLRRSDKAVPGKGFEVPNRASRRSSPSRKAL